MPVVRRGAAVAVAVRRANLLRSVARRLDAGISVSDAAYMWRRHRLIFPFAAFAFLGVMTVASWAGAEDWPTRIVIGLAGVAVAVAATTDYKVLARTSEGVVLLSASRIRQTATGDAAAVPADAQIKPVGGNVLATDWDIAGSVYTVPRSSERAISRIAGLG